MTTESDISREVYGGILAAIGESTKKYLSDGYSDTAFKRLIEAVVTRKADKLSAILDDALEQAFSGNFRDQLRDAAVHKLAKILISKMEGEIEKRANELRTDPAFRARLTLAIEKAVKEVGVSS